MVSWADFEAAAPELAAESRELIERFGYLFVGTIRRDGTPRISPVEANVVGDHLMLVLMAGTLKVGDLVRDPRVVLNAPIRSAGDPGAELKVRGRMIEITDQEQRDATADAIKAVSGWRPPPEWHFFAVDLEDVALIGWESGAMDMTRWTPHAGIDRVRRSAPAVE
jgi:Pyridoxamine 5'-phosphate oxidase